MARVLSIIIPVFNEEQAIGKLLPLVVKQKTSGWQKQIIVVDDGSDDQTAAILLKWKKKCTILRKQKNYGKGAAISTGLKKATGEIILIQDADLEYLPSNYPALIAPFENPVVNVVYGSRFFGAHLSTFLTYEIGNKCITMIANILFNTNITDIETGYKAFRRPVLLGIDIRAHRFDFEPEITARILKKGYQIFEVPISYFGRKFEDGKKLTWRDGVIALFTLLRWRLWDT
jgi:glycosyltransferase involved in cell wall biosynthesis